MEDKEELTTLPAQGTSHCSCLEHCFLFLSAGVVPEPPRQVAEARALRAAADDARHGGRVRVPARGRAGRTQGRRVPQRDIPTGEHGVRVPARGRVQRTQAARGRLGAPWIFGYLPQRGHTHSVTKVQRVTNSESRCTLLLYIFTMTTP